MADGVRMDKWLWAARLFKTRALAAEAIRGGKVHLEGRAVKASRDVQVGDELCVTRGQVRLTVVVRALSDKRGPAPEAASLYEETPESIAERERQAELRRLAGPLDDLGGRPTKRDRRRFEARRRR